MYWIERSKIGKRALIFFVSFFVSRQKMKSPSGLAPLKLLLRSKTTKEKLREGDA
jgi:hypothetical protein